jgi:hypothetical protein
MFSANSGRVKATEALKQFVVPRCWNTQPEHRRAVAMSGCNLAIGYDPTHAPSKVAYGNERFAYVFRLNVDIAVDNGLVV